MAGRSGVEGVSLRRINSRTIDGECCVCGADGVPDFAKLHSGSYDSAVVLYAFDLLELNGTDRRAEPLEKRKSKLQKLLEPADPIRLQFISNLMPLGGCRFSTGRLQYGVQQNT